jgi:hypothetical protein
MRQSVVHGLAQLKAKLNMLGDESVETKTFIFFVGSTVPATGDSWCPDCKYNTFINFSNIWNPAL